MMSRIQLFALSVSSSAAFSQNCAPIGITNNPAARIIRKTHQSLIWLTLAHAHLNICRYPLLGNSWVSKSYLGDMGMFLLF